MESYKIERCENTKITGNSKHIKTRTVNRT